MLKFLLPRCFLLAFLLCLCAANLPAQEPEMRAPSVPDVLPPPPPDPDALPLPPEMEWGPLAPKDEGGSSDAPAAAFVPAPEPEASIAPPPPPMIEEGPPGGFDPEAAELAKPDVEVWRTESQWPQIPAQRPSQLEQAYIAGTDLVTLRAQFSPLAAGKRVYVRAGRGMNIQPPDAVLTVSASGECLLSAQLDESFPRSHIIFYCDGIKTVLPVVRATLAKVVEKEAETGGGQ